MKKQLPLYILNVFLIVVNGFFLINYMGDSKEDMPREQDRSKNFISDRLNFSEEQSNLFDELEREHREKMRSFSEQIRRSKDALFNQISKPEVDASTIDSITSAIGEFEKKKDMEVFDHFRAIYEICDDTQKTKFNKLVKDALHKGPPPRGRRPPKGMGKDRPGSPPPRH